MKAFSVVRVRVPFSSLFGTTTARYGRYGVVRGQTQLIVSELDTSIYIIFTHTHDTLLFVEITCSGSARIICSHSAHLSVNFMVVSGGAARFLSLGGGVTIGLHFFCFRCVRWGLPIASHQAIKFASCLPCGPT